MESDLAESILRDVAQIRHVAEELEAQLEELVPVPEFPDPTPDGHLDSQYDEANGDGLFEQALPAVHPAKSEREEQLQQTVERSLERLADQLASGHSAEFEAVIRFWSSFVKYSPGNVLLIMAQKPNAQAVASYATWRKLGRQVRKGARACFIWCPVLKTVTNEETGLEEERLVGFKPGSVFSDYDLIGDEALPSLFRPLPDTHGETYAAVLQHLKNQGIRIYETNQLPPGVQGRSNGQEIQLLAGRDSQNQLATIAHEVTHHLWHHTDEAKQLPRAQLEFEAETVAAVVCAVLHVDYPTAPSYILAWGGSVQQLKASLPRIHQLLKKVLAVMLPKEKTTNRRAAA